MSSDLYFGSGATPNFFAINQASGVLDWSYNMGSVYSENAPAYANGVVYVQSGKGTSSPPTSILYGFNSSTGQVKFASAFSAQWETYLAPTVVGGTAYIDGGYYGGIYAFNTSGGTQKWYATMPQYDGWTPSVANGLC